MALTPRFPSLQHGFGLGGWIPRSLEAVPNTTDVNGQDDVYWMKQALLAAMEGNGLAHPNPCVGAVLVKDGQLLSRAATQVYGGLHAERAALQQIPSEAARGATCYTTLEPCAHHGKQPPCSDGLIAAGIARCVVGSGDPFPLVAGRGLAQLEAAGIAVTTGILQNEMRAWHFPFFASLALQQKRPVLIGKWAQTLDGHLADDRGVSQWISGSRARAYTHWLRQKYDAILVGMGTVLADAPSLTVRDSAPPRLRHPHKVVFDPHGRLAGASEKVGEALRTALSTDGASLYWLVHRSASQLPPSWAPYRHLIVPVPLEENASWEDHFQRLSEAYLVRQGRPLQSLLVEGGPQLLTRLMRADLLDAWHVFIRAGVLGGSEHRIGRLPQAEGAEASHHNPSRALHERDDFHLLGSYQLDDDILLECVHRRFTLWS